MQFYHIHHHTCHAANGFSIKFQKAAIMTIDFRGENDCTAMFSGNQKCLWKIFQEIPNF